MGVARELLAELLLVGVGLVGRGGNVDASGGTMGEILSFPSVYVP